MDESTIQDVTERLEGREYIKGRNGKIFVLREFEITDLNTVVSINRRVLLKTTRSFSLLSITGAFQRPS